MQRHGDRGRESKLKQQAASRHYRTIPPHPSAQHTPSQQLQEHAAANTDQHKHRECCVWRTFLFFTNTEPQVGRRQHPTMDFETPRSKSRLGSQHRRACSSSFISRILGKLLGLGRAINSLAMRGCSGAPVNSSRILQAAITAIAREAMP